MPLPKNIEYYEQELQYWDSALQAETGIKITAPSPQKAVSVRHRLNMARKLLRDKSLEVYEEGDPQRGVTSYDDMEVTLSGAEVTIRKTAPLKIEVLND
jgi:hypothetical protein